MKDFKLLNLRLALFIVCSLAIGIVTAYCFAIGVFASAICLLSLFLISITLFIIFGVSDNSKRIRNVVFSALFILFFLFGAISFNLNIHAYDSADVGGHYYTVTGKVTNISEISDGVKLTVSQVEIFGVQSCKPRYNVKVYVSGECDIDVGTRIEFSAYLKSLKAIDGQVLSQYNLDSGVKYVAYLDSGEIYVTGRDLSFFESVNLSIREVLKEGLSEQEFSVAYALLTGNSDYMDSDVISSYRQAGVAHIFAVSGLHIGFLATVLNFIMKRLKIKRLIKAIVVTFALLLYAGVCGFSSSSLRAVVMTAVLLFSSLDGRRYDPLSSVSIAGLILLIGKPVNLFCVGFQLSFIVVLGMILLSNPISRLLKFLPDKLSRSLGAVLSAQIAGIPICLLAFGEFSVISIMANLLFIPIVSVLFTFLIFATFIGIIFNIPNIALFLSNYALKIINFCITALDYEIFMIGGISIGVFAIFYYLVMVVLSGVVNVKKIGKIILATILASTFVVGTACTSHYEYNTPKCVIIGSYSFSATLIMDGETNVLVVSKIGSNLNYNRLEHSVKEYRVDSLDAVILLNQENKDMQEIMSRLYMLVNVSEFYYCYEKDESMEKVLNKSFPNIKVDNLTSGEVVSVENFLFKSMIEGRAMECEFDEIKFSIFSPISNSVSDYSGLEQNQKLIIAFDECYNVFSYYEPSEKVTYLEGEGYKNGQSNGDLVIYLK